MSYVGKVKAGANDYPVVSTGYGTCTTAAATAEKAVTMANFDTLLEGVTIHILFQNSNTAASPTLNVNSTGAKAIYIAGVSSPGSTALTSWDANSIVSFTYDGTSWRMNDVVKALRDRVAELNNSAALSLTALANGWSNATPPTQTLSATGVTASNNIIVGLGSGATSSQYDEAAAAKLVCTAQGADSITLTCYGDTPTDDLPISVMILP